MPNTIVSNTVRDFPLWYTPVKWLLPLTLGVISALCMGAVLTGALPAVGMAQWLPVIYNSLEGIRAAAMLSITMGMVGSLVGVFTATVARATVLFQLNERLASTGVDQGKAAGQKIADLEKALAYKTEEVVVQREENGKLAGIINLFAQKHPKDPIAKSIAAAQKDNVSESESVASAEFMDSDIGSDLQDEDVVLQVNHHSAKNGFQSVHSGSRGKRAKRNRKR